jgi:hypothetical protein
MPDTAPIKFALELDFLYYLDIEFPWEAYNLIW